MAHDGGQRTLPMPFPRLHSLVLQYFNRYMPDGSLFDFHSRLKRPVNPEAVLSQLRQIALGTPRFSRDRAEIHIQPRSRRDSAEISAQISSRRGLSDCA